MGALYRTGTTLTAFTYRWQQREQFGVQCLAQGYFYLCTGGAGDQTTNPAIGWTTPSSYTVATINVQMLPVHVSIHYAWV